MASGLFRSTAVVGGMTVISRLLGFVRDMVLARAFGAGMATDAFFVAFKLPNFFRRLFGENAFATAFVPVLTDYRERGDTEALHRLLGAVAGLLAVVAAGGAVAGMIAAPFLVRVLAPGFGGDAAKVALTADLLRLTFPYLLFITLVAFAGGILNAFGRFAVPAFTPVLLNVALIIAALWAAPAFETPVMALGWGVVAGGLLQLAFQVPALARRGLLPRPRWQPWHAGVRRIVRLMGPNVLSVSVAQISILVDTILASLLQEGSISFLYYSDRLVQFPVGVFGIALGTAILPALSGQVSRGEEAAYRATLDRGLRLIIIIGLPATAGLILLGGPILTTLFQYGAFTPATTALTYPSLAAYALGIVGTIGVKVTAPAFYSRQDTRTPMRAAAWAMGANVVLNFLLIGPLAHAGLALATSLAAFLNAGLLLGPLVAQGRFWPSPGWTGHLLRVAGALAALVAAGWAVTPAPGVWHAAGAGVRVAMLAGCVATAGVAYLGTAWLLGVSEVRALPRWLHQRFFDGPVGGR